ncbi:MAG: hypothetical protein WC707_01465 [Candidatus Babeliaceae bacterium]|jgi:hypothetical protein
MSTHIEKIVHVFSYSISCILHIILIAILLLIPIHMLKESFGPTSKAARKAAPIFFNKRQKTNTQTSAPLPLAIPTTAPTPLVQQTQPIQTTQEQALGELQPVITQKRRPARSNNRWYKQPPEQKATEKTVQGNSSIFEKQSTHQQALAQVLDNQCKNFLTNYHQEQPPKAEPVPYYTAQAHVEEFQTHLYNAKVTRACAQAARIFSKTYYSHDDRWIKTTIQLLINRDGTLRSIILEPDQDEKVMRIIKDFFSSAELPKLPRNFKGDVFIFRVNGKIVLRQGLNNVFVTFHEF